MPRFKTFTAMLLAAGALLTAAAFAQGTGRWTIGTPMPSARTEVAVAEAGGKIYVVEIEEQADRVWRQIDGLRNMDQIASAVSLPLTTVQDTLQALSQIGAVVLPPQ